MEVDKLDMMWGAGRKLLVLERIMNPKEHKRWTEKKGFTCGEGEDRGPPRRTTTPCKNMNRCALCGGNDC